MSMENESVSEYNDRLNSRIRERVRWMDVKKWKVIQSLLISAVIAYIGIVNTMAPSHVVMALVAVNSVLGVDYAAVGNIQIDLTNDKGD